MLRSLMDLELTVVCRRSQLGMTALSRSRSLASAHCARNAESAMNLCTMRQRGTSAASNTSRGVRVVDMLPGMPQASAIVLLFFGSICTSTYYCLNELKKRDVAAMALPQEATSADTQELVLHLHESETVQHQRQLGQALLRRAAELEERQLVSDWRASGASVDEESLTEGEQRAMRWIEYKTALLESKITFTTTPLHEIRDVLPGRRIFQLLEDKHNITPFMLYVSAQHASPVEEHMLLISRSVEIMRKIFLAHLRDFALSGRNSVDREEITQALHLSINVYLQNENQHSLYSSIRQPQVCIQPVSDMYTSTQVPPASDRYTEPASSMATSRVMCHASDFPLIYAMRDIENCVNAWMCRDENFNQIKDLIEHPTNQFSTDLIRHPCAQYCTGMFAAAQRMFEQVWIWTRSGTVHATDAEKQRLQHAKFNYDLALKLSTNLAEEIETQLYKNISDYWFKHGFFDRMVIKESVYFRKRASEASGINTGTYTSSNLLSLYAICDSAFYQRIADKDLRTVPTVGGKSVNNLLGNEDYSNNFAKLKATFSAHLPVGTELPCHSTKCVSTIPSGGALSYSDLLCGANIMVKHPQNTQMWQQPRNTQMGQQRQNILMEQQPQSDVLAAIPHSVSREIARTLQKYGVVVLRNALDKQQVEKVRRQLHMDEFLAAASGEKLLADDGDVVTSRPTPGTLYCAVRGTSTEDIVGFLQSQFTSIMHAALPAHVSVSVMEAAPKSTLKSSLQDTKQRRMYVSDMQTKISDPMSMERNFYQDTNAAGYTVFVPFQKCNALSAGLQVIPGSHHLYTDDASSNQHTQQRIDAANACTAATTVNDKQYLGRLLKTHSDLHVGGYLFPDNDAGNDVGKTNNDECNVRNDASNVRNDAGKACNDAVDVRNDVRNDAGNDECKVRNVVINVSDNITNVSDTKIPFFAYLDRFPRLHKLLRFLHILTEGPGIYSPTLSTGDVVILDSRAFHRFADNDSWVARGGILIRYDFENSPAPGTLFRGFNMRFSSYTGRLLEIISNAYARI